MATEDLEVLKSSYKAFVTTPAGVHLISTLAQREKDLIYQAQKATDALQSMASVQKSAAYGEMKALIDSLTQ